MRKLRVNVIVVLCTLASIAFIHAEDKTEETIKKGIIEFRTGMMSDSEKVRLKAFDEFMPTHKDLKAIFGNDVDMIWPMLNKGRSHMRKNTDKFKQEFDKRGNVQSIKLIDVRKNDSSGRYTDIIKTVPKNIPLYRAVMKYQKGSGGSSTYVIVNSKAKHIRGLEGMLEMIKKIKSSKDKQK